MSDKWRSGKAYGVLKKGEIVMVSIRVPRKSMSHRYKHGLPVEKPSLLPFDSDNSSYFSILYIRVAYLGVQKYRSIRSFLESA
jgi:hypothetical protein